MNCVNRFYPSCQPELGIVTVWAYFTSPASVTSIGQ
jgi:hypothetical protein